MICDNFLKEDIERRVEARGVLTQHVSASNAKLYSTVIFFGCLKHFIIFSNPFF